MSTTTTDTTPHADPSRPTPHVRVAILGAGFGGIGAAIRLERDLGERDYLILERHEEAGGTWWANTYPGAQCDIPSNLYSFSFAPNPDWHRAFAPQAEIRDYLIDLTHRYGLRDRIRFGTTVQEARWDAGAHRWEIETSRGPLTASYLIAAPGPLSTPTVPALDGLERFGGTIMHTADWNHDVDLTGKRIAVVGSGASAIQAVPELARIASELTVFQRTAPWIVPHTDRAIGSVERLLLRRVPMLQRAMRDVAYLGRELLIPGLVYEPALQRAIEWLAANHRRQQIADPALREACTPHYRVGCKRILPSNKWYPTLQRPNVTLVPEGVARVTETGVESASGIRADVDVIVFATGFEVTDIPLAHHVRGRDGRLLADVWDGSPHAHRGISVHGFPNLFFIIGPYTGLGSNSMVFMIEAQLNYILDALRRTRGQTLEVRREAEEAFSERMQRKLRRSVWVNGGCGSWYLDKKGRVTTLWPDFTFRYWSETRRFDAASYELTSALEPALSASP